MDWTRRIDGYCERTGPDFWSEPINAVTNGAFWIAAAIVLIYALRARRLDAPVAWLIALMVAIGIGSFLFHTFATVWAAILDTSPIGLFILSYFAVAMNRFAGLGWGWAALATVGFLIALGLTSWALRPLLLPVIGGSVSYVPALLGLFAVGGWLAWRRHPAAGWLFAAAGVFCVSLTFRAMDQPVCPEWPIGTHFMWHVLNAIVLGTLTAAVVRHGRPRLDDRNAFA